MTKNLNRALNDCTFSPAKRDSRPTRRYFLCGDELDLPRNAFAKGRLFSKKCYDPIMI
jgi:hypothetical protein